MESLDLILSEYKANEGYCTKQERSAWKSPSSEPEDSPWEGKSLKQDSIAEGWKLMPTSNSHLPEGAFSLPDVLAGVQKLTLKMLQIRS